jgi:preprotein translocase subunit SecG
VVCGRIGDGRTLEHRAALFAALRHGTGLTRATRPLVMVFIAIAFAVTIIFKANVEAQGGAYATGVLVLMSSAAIAVTLSARRRGGRWWPFLLIALVFAYTTIVNVIERPEGIKIASFFIGTIILTSLVSRVLRSTELRVEK